MKIFWTFNLSFVIDILAFFWFRDFLGYFKKINIIFSKTSGNLAFNPFSYCCIENQGLKWNSYFGTLASPFGKLDKDSVSFNRIIRHFNIVR